MTTCSYQGCLDIACYERALFAEETMWIVPVCKKHAPDEVRDPRDTWAKEDKGSR